MIYKYFILLHSFLFYSDYAFDVQKVLGGHGFRFIHLSYSHDKVDLKSFTFLSVWVK